MNCGPATTVQDMNPKITGSAVCATGMSPIARWLWNTTFPIRAGEVGFETPRSDGHSVEHALPTPPEVAEPVGDFVTGKNQISRY